MADEPITIADAVGELRSQIADARERLREDDLRFDVTEVVLEILGSISKTTSVNGEAKVGFSVLGASLSAGGGASESSQISSSHKVILKLKVSEARADGVSVQIGAIQAGDF